MLHIALFEPRIAPNTGNIIRLAANNGCRLHLIEPLGFELEDKLLRRAGLDYHDMANVTRYPNYEHFSEALKQSRILACTTRGKVSYDQIQYREDDVLLFGSEVSGLSDRVHAQITEDCKIKIPMRPSNRSLNLSNSVAIISYEAWRQLGFKGCL